MAYQWCEVLLNGIRNDYARPTIHARNLWHTSLAMYDAWAALSEHDDTYLLGKTLGDFTCPFDDIEIPTNPAELKLRFSDSSTYSPFT